MDSVKQAQELANKIYSITKALVLTGDIEHEEAEISAYANMVEAREPLVRKLAALQESIDESARETDEFAAVLDTIHDITAINEQHDDFIENMREAVQGAIRKVKHGQKIHAGYQAQTPEPASRRFDTKH